MQSVVDGLAVDHFVSDVEAAPIPVVLVHGAMDRAGGFRRCSRFLDGLDAYAYDRRGYAASLGNGISRTMVDQVSDLMAVVDSITDGQVVVVGHSLGGLIALHAALAAPGRIASIGVWEPPLPWFEWYVSDAAAAANGTAAATDPEEAAEAFMRVMIGDARWERLGVAMRETRRAEGDTLRSDLELTRSPDSRVDLTEVRLPVTIGHGSDSAARFKASAARIMADVADPIGIEIAGSHHGAHLSHPTEFAAFVRAAHARAPRPTIAA